MKHLYWARGKGNPAFALNAGNCEGQASVLWPARLIFRFIRCLKIQLCLVDWICDIMTEFLK